MFQILRNLNKNFNLVYRKTILIHMLMHIGFFAWLKTKASHTLRVTHGTFCMISWGRGGGDRFEAPFSLISTYFSFIINFIFLLSSQCATYLYSDFPFINRTLIITETEHWTSYTVVFIWHILLAKCMRYNDEIILQIVGLKACSAYECILRIPMLKNTIVYDLFIVMPINWKASYLGWEIFCGCMCECNSATCQPPTCI